MKNNTTKSVILIVDDKPGNIYALENLLASKDTTLLNAKGGKEALQIILNNEIDLIILDVQMPEMDGFEVANILKSNKRTKDIPIIFASAEKKELQSQMKGYEEGAIDYLFKPLDPDIVKAKVSVFLKIQLQKKELIEKNNSLQKSALLINNSADIIGIIDAETLKIEEMNQAFTNILGYSLKEIKDTAILFFLSNADRIMVKQLSGKTNDQLSFETHIYCKDRSLKWLQWKVVVKESKWYINARDITELKQVEKIRNYLATVVKQSNDAIYIHDHEGQIISWNEGAEKMYGYTETEALKMKIWNIIPEYMQPETGQLVHQIIHGEKIHDHETKRITKHGKLLDVLFSAAVIDDSIEEQQSIAITEQDITQQKIADEHIKQLNTDLQNNVVQLELSNKEMESFSYSVSHDLRAPLRALSGYSAMIEDGYEHVLDAEAKRLLDHIKSNAKKMGILIDDLLAFSRMGKTEVRKSHIDMAEMVKYILQDMNTTKPINVDVKLNTILPAYGDRSLLNQVWVNLISNAIKYSSKNQNPVIEIQSIPSDEEVTYSVKDNGVGFDMKYADKLFGVFQRLHSNTDFEGTGVGLAIVHRIITKHGGKIWAEAKQNEGATFYFTLQASAPTEVKQL
ncbi:MAG: arcB [Chitinophagaceae bacterium]|nr:arcB [Chitinophagaceae bacterium]